MHITVKPGAHTVKFVNSDQGLTKTITVTVGAGETKPAVAQAATEPPLSTQGRSAIAAGSDPPAMAAAAKPRILVVDDEPGLRDMLAILFRREGLDVTLAPGFATALRRGHATRPSPTASSSPTC